MIIKIILSTSQRTNSLRTYFNSNSLKWLRLPTPSWLKCQSMARLPPQIQCTRFEWQFAAIHEWHTQECNIITQVEPGHFNAWSSVVTTWQPCLLLWLHKGSLLDISIYCNFSGHSWTSQMYKALTYTQLHSCGIQQWFSDNFHICSGITRVWKGNFMILKNKTKLGLLPG